MYGTIPGYPQYPGILSILGVVGHNIHGTTLGYPQYPGILNTFIMYVEQGLPRIPQEYLTLRDALRQLRTTCGSTGHVFSSL